jgi:hypothetical protein
MDIPRLNDALTSSWWKRQAKTLAGAKPAVLDQRLDALERSHKLLDFSRFEGKGLKTPEEAEKLISLLDGDFTRMAKAVREFAKDVEKAAETWKKTFKADPKAKEGLAAVDRVLREAGDYPDVLNTFVKTTQERLGKVLDELQGDAELEDDKDAKPDDTPERRRVRARMKDQMRIVKHRTDRKVYFLLCVGHKSSAAWLHPSPVTDAQKPLLTKVLQGDSGFKWYRGQCVWEEGAVTFVGTNLSSSLARRIQTGADELAGGSVGYRIRAHD